MYDLATNHPADIAEYLATLDRKERNLAFLMLSNEKKSQVFTYFDTIDQQEIIQSLGHKETRELVGNLAPDDRTQMFTDFPDELIRKMIDFLGSDEKSEALTLLGYDSNSIARLMTPHYIKARPEWTVRKVLNNIKRYGKKAETLNFVYVIDEANKLIDDLRIGQLLMVSEDTKISSLMDRSFVSITTTEKQEDGLKIFQKYDREALPIITERGGLVGIVTFDDILDKISERDTEDIQKFGGSDGLEVSYTNTTLIGLVKKRAGWLILLFLGEMLTASAMGFFDAEIEKAVVLALFIPLIISSGGNSGSQAASLIIRAMALKELKIADWWYVMKKEILSGLLLGAILGTIGFIRIFIWQQAHIYDYGPYWFWVALSVGFSLVAIVLWGTLSGSLIPFALRKLGLDPATASAPFVATLVDVTGLIIYFTISALFLSGRLL